MKKGYHDNKIHMIFGDIGSGKTTYAAAIAAYCLAHGIPVYANTPISGCCKISVDDLKKYRIEGSMILIDEAASAVNCRNWRDTGTDLLKLLQQIRHYDCTIYWITQSVSAIDCQIIALCDDAQECIKHGGSTHIISWKKHVDKRGNAFFVCPDRRIDYIFARRIRRKKYYRLFDTHYIPPEDLKKEYIPTDTW